MAENQIKPQAGFQADFLSTPADIAIGGGSAGAGKTFSLLMEPLRHYNNPNFGAVFFRRSIPQIKNIGGLWDESLKLYPLLGFKPNLSELKYSAPEKATYKFTHLQYEDTIYDWQGAQVPFFAFDELTHFTKKQFWYIASRNRSTCGVKPYIRATCNPDPESWVAELLKWWIDQKTGFPIKERAGVIRYLMQSQGKYVWGNSVQEVLSKVPHILKELPKELDPRNFVKSVTFIPGSVYENKKLMDTNPEYIGNLLSLPEQEKQQLLKGNWKIPIDGMSLFDYFSVNDLFSNFSSHEKNQYYITCDVARFGKDLAIIKIWHDYEVVKIIIFTKSSINKLGQAIELERSNFHIPKSHVLVDQDGVGGGLVDYGGYMGFSGNRPATSMETELGKKIRENYQNLKTQCYYLFASKVNLSQVSINVTQENCIIDDHHTTTLKYDGQNMEVIDIIKKQLRAIKKKIMNSDGKLQINSKDDQKVLLNGKSPDFADTLMMRIWFELDTNPEPEIYTIG